MEILNALFADTFWMAASFISMLVVTLTSTINAKLNPNKVWKCVISWVLSIGLTVGAYFLHIISVSDPAWLSLIGVCIVVGLSSNGLYSIPAIKDLMKKYMGLLQNGMNKNE